MQKFNSLGALAQYLMKQTARNYVSKLSGALSQIGQSVQQEAKSEIGTYQSGVGPYPPTAPLAEATIERKAKEGYGMHGDPDTPLYATGAFQEDINYKVDEANLSVDIGTNQDYIVYTELGTGKMPPRPIFGTSALRAVPKTLPLIGAYATAGITGEDVTAYTKTYGEHTQLEP
jgi:hypothetical protein